MLLQTANSGCLGHTAGVLIYVSYIFDLTYAHH